VGSYPPDSVKLSEEQPVAIASKNPDTAENAEASVPLFSSRYAIPDLLTQVKSRGGRNGAVSDNHFG
jgi:hypothetical protein